MVYEQDFAVRMLVRGGGWNLVSNPIVLESPGHYRAVVILDSRNEVADIDRSNNETSYGFIVLK